MIKTPYIQKRSSAPLSLLLLALSPICAAPAHADSSTFAAYVNASRPSYSEQWLYYPGQTKSEHTASLSETVLSSHNEERRRWRVPPLRWDEGLVADARAYAGTLAQKGYLEHADMSSRAQPQGENLWMGTRDAFGYDQMMSGFLEERRNYVARAVPHISKTGNWADTGHYSQMIWRTTTSVGCAVASNKDFDFLVCRYSPAGNVWGMRADEGGPLLRERRALASAKEKGSQKLALLSGN